MKKYWLIGLYALALTSCDSFLNCEPENNFSSEGFLESESDLRLYTNGFLQSFLPSEETIAWGGDQYADFCATRSSTTFLIGDTWDDTQQGGWGTGDWGNLRQINYFLDNLPNAKGKVTDAVYLHNEGVGRFWRAYFYYGMVRTFGDVPWYETTLDVDNRDELYKPRDKREVVMDKILEDLDFACTNCSTDKTLTESSTLITKWVALALKSRICLFEGTYRKYHAVTARVTAALFQIFSNLITNFLIIRWINQIAHFSTAAYHKLRLRIPHHIAESLIHLINEHFIIFIMRKSFSKVFEFMHSG